MTKPTPVIGIDAEVRLLVRLLRHPAPVVPELARQALEYLDHAAANDAPVRATALDRAGSRGGGVAFSGSASRLWRAR
jgi:hypothetical protein